MPLAIMPYRPRMDDPYTSLTPTPSTLSVNKQSALHKSASNRSLYDGTKYVLGALAGLLISHKDTTSIDTTDNEDSESDSTSRYEMDLCDFLPTTTRSFTPNTKSVPLPFNNNKQHTVPYTHIVECELNKSTDRIIDSIKYILKNSIYSRILILGEYSEQRSRYIARTIDCVPIDVMKLQHANSTDSRNGVILYSNNVYDLTQCEDNVIDAILVFDIQYNNTHDIQQYIQQLYRVVKPTGVIAGTGIFKTNSGSSPLVSDSDDNEPTMLTLREFRTQIEQTGLDVHTAIDLTLEGHSSDLINQSLDTVYGRFLATKPSDDDIEFTTHNNILHKTDSADSFNHILVSPTDSEHTTTYDYSLASTSADTPPYTRNNTLSFNKLSDSTCLQSSTAHTFEPVGITGIAIGLPNSSDPTRNVFDKSNIDRLLAGEQQITLMSEIDKQSMVQQNVFQLVKADSGRIKQYFNTTDSVLQVSSKLCGIDLLKQYNIPQHVIDALDLSFQYAIAAGIEALLDAGINIYDADRNLVGLPESMQYNTGVIFASSFPGIDSMVQEVTKHVQSQYTHDVTTKYEYDRKLLFKILVLANCQLAELIHAKGPNTQINAACAGTTQAVTLAHDWIRLNRCKRVIVISADVATSDTLNSYISSGFMALGAATKANTVYDASAPFDCRRTGMIMGSGAVSLVVESKSSILERQCDWYDTKAQIVASHIANSAYHACLMDKQHITEQLQYFITTIETEHNIDRTELAQNLLYYSHETGTGVCAAIELHALKHTFGTEWRQIKIANTKGYTGHAMGVAFEECMAVHSLHKHAVPPIANLQTIDPTLDLLPEQLVTGGYINRKYVLRFAAGFGSQLAYVLYSQPQ